MASPFKGWGASWGESWGAVTGTGFVRGTATITFTATGVLEGIYTPPTGENGPSGGANWTRGYKPTHDYITPRRRSRRDELLFLRG